MFVHTALLEVTYWSHDFFTWTSTAGYEGSGHPCGPGLALGKPLDCFLHARTLGVSRHHVEKHLPQVLPGDWIHKPCSNMKPPHIRNSWLLSGELSAFTSSPQTGTGVSLMVLSAPVCCSSHQCWCQLHYAFFSVGLRENRNRPKLFIFILWYSVTRCPKSSFENTSSFLLLYREPLYWIRLNLLDIKSGQPVVCAKARILVRREVIIMSLFCSWF